MPAHLGDAGHNTKGHHGMTVSTPAPVAPTGPKQKNPVGLAAIIVGGVALVFAIIPVLSFLAWLPAIAAIALGIIGLVRKNRTRGLAWGGLGLGVVAWIIAIVVSVASVAGLAGAVNDAVKDATAAPVEETTVEEPAATSEPAAEQPSEAPQMTIGQTNAVGKAEQYLSVMGFSRTGLIQQLEFEGFPTADAEFAVDTIAPDWNEQAAKKGKTYLEATSFSRDSLIEQLVFEGFTQEQAEYGATANGY